MFFSIILRIVAGTLVLFLFGYGIIPVLFLLLAALPIPAPIENELSPEIDD
jgi:hypothetical protein